MKIALRVVFGFAIGILGVIVTLNLGLLPETNRGLWGAAFIAITSQCISFWVFRRGITIQVIIGLFLCALVVRWLLDSHWSGAWEPEYEDGSSPITWRSVAVFLLILTSTQFAAYGVLLAVRNGTLRLRHPKRTWGS